ncbi:type IX secretion system protein PorG [Flavobacterium koreense]
MKRIFLFIFILGLTKLNAQIHEVGVFLGGSNYIGDVGKANYVNPNELAYGLIYKWNKSPRHSWRISYTQSKITANDLDSDVPGRFKRGYDFENNIKELSLGLEFNFFDFNLHNFDKLVTPYVYSGLSYTNYDELYVINGVSKIDINHGTFAIPMIVGVKSNIMPNLILGVEVGARYTMTDNLDGSLPKNEDLEPLKFGNINSKDWYVFSGFTLTYTFGEKPCYCAD